jgi:hypothetical protein
MTIRIGKKGSEFQPTILWRSPMLRAVLILDDGETFIRWEKRVLIIDSLGDESYVWQEVPSYSQLVGLLGRCLVSNYPKVSYLGIVTDDYMYRTIAMNEFPQGGGEDAEPESESDGANPVPDSSGVPDGAEGITVYLVPSKPAACATVPGVRIVEVSGADAQMMADAPYPVTIV